MSSEQLCLLQAAKPLAERFGNEFFKRVPASPGVYYMSGAAGALLYIGKAKNLRQRLHSYKNAKSGAVSRKILRLVCQVRSITWEVCLNPTAALLRENELLRLHKPKFNVLNTRPEHYVFWGLQRNQNRIGLRLTKSDAPESGEELFGAFKSLHRVRYTYQALLRVLWCAEYLIQDPYHLPSALVRDKVPERFEMRFDRLNPDELEKYLRNYLLGQEENIVGMIRLQLPGGEHVSRCLQTLVDQDLEKIQEFYQYGTARNRNLRHRSGLESNLIGKADLDDLLVLDGQRYFEAAPPQKNRD